MTTEWKFVGWYYKHQGRTLGPVPTEELFGLCTAGQVRCHDPVWKVWQVGNHRETLQTRAELALELGRSAPEADVPAGPRERHAAG
ncbi:MAG: hypothetical protein JNM56_06630 [Planctomycetia bacterium]|nr:hypothetical protein [Planctomycetia bacterium]